MKLLDWFTKEPTSKPSVSERELTQLAETLRASSRQAGKIAKDLDRAREGLTGGQAP